MQLSTIREARAAKVGEARSLLEAAEREGRQLTADEAKTFDGIKSAITDLEGQESRALFLAEAERRAAGTVVAGSGDGNFEQLERRVSLLKVLQAGMEGRALDGAEAEYNRELERRNGRKAKGFYLPMRALENRINTTGSAADLVGTDHRGDQYIEPLRNALLARKLGVRVLSGLRGDVSIPKAGTSTVSGWVAENTALTPSDMTFGSVGLTPKHVGALSEMSRQLIQQSDPSIEALLRDDLAFGIAQAIDGALIHGGGANEPAGVISTLGTPNGTLAGPTWAQVLKIVEQVEEANALSPSHAWLTNASGKAKLAATLKVSGDAGAGFLYEGGQLADRPVHVTEQLAGVTSSSDNTTAAIFGDWSQVLLGIWSELDILVNPFAEGAYSKGNVLIRAMATCDIAIRHPEAFVFADDIPVL
ncbi:MAG TPA: phage major capsid protein [Chiayiivirga sp.]|nr:phage major capsid protein [Chiayiivirga sp.]